MIKYKILHIPSGTYLKIRAENEKFVYTNSNDTHIGNMIWSDYEINQQSKENNTNYSFNPILCSKKTAQLLLKKFISGLTTSEFMPKSEASIYSEEVFFSFINDE